MHNIPASSFIIVLLLMMNGCLQKNIVNGIITDNSIQNGSQSRFSTGLEPIELDTFEYQDGQVIISHHQQKPSQFYFTPFPHIEPNRTECYYDELSGHNELILTVSLYTPHLFQSIQRHIKQHQNICRTEHCTISLLPIHSIRLFQQGRRTADSQKKYTLDSEWHKSKQIRQSIEFIIYTSNISVCEHLKNLIVTRCRLPNLELHYLLHGQQTVTRKLEVTTEHITRTSMYNQIRSQLISADQDIVALNENDYKNLLADIIDQITQSLRIEEGYEGLQDPRVIEHLLERQLQSKQVHLDANDDHLWNSLYWPSDLTRPDRLSNVLNQILQQDLSDSDRFHYNQSGATELLKQHLQLREKQKLEQHLAALSISVGHTIDTDTHVGYEDSGKFFDILSEIVKNNTDVDVQNTDNIRSLTDHSSGSSTNIIRTMHRSNAEKLISFISEHVQLVNHTIRPKPIDVKLVNFRSLKPNSMLISTSVLIKIRANIHVLPLRCSSEAHQNAVATIPITEDKYDHLLNIVNNITNLLDGKITNLNRKLVENFDQLKADFNKKIEQTDIAIRSAMNQMLNQSCRNPTANCKSKNKWKQHGVTVAGGNGRGNETNQLNSPFGIFIDDDQRMYIADHGNDRIIQWKRGKQRGRIIAGDNGKGSETDQLSYPTDVVSEKRNNALIIADYGHKRVLRWSIQNKTKPQVLLSDIDCFGLSIAKDESIYISDLVKNEVRRWKEGETQGELVAGGNGQGNGLNQFNEPRFIFVDDAYSVYVSDYYNHRVMKWVKGATEGIVVAGGNGKGNSSKQLSYPKGVIVDQSDQIYVADGGNDRVMRWSEGNVEGEIIVGGNGEGQKSDQLDGPSGFTFDAEGNLYVVDQRNDRVQRFERDVD